MISEFPSPENCDTPMTGDALQRMREFEGPFLTDMIPQARSIVGLGIFIVRGARPDGLFAGIAVSQHIVNNLTTYVGNASCAGRLTSCVPSISASSFARRIAWTAFPRSRQTRTRRASMQ